MGSWTAAASCFDWPGERSIAAMLQVASLEIAYSFLFAVPVYLLMRAVYKKVGGSVLA
jgi:hypothetical protein